jgi:hypothetical protein
MKTLNPKCRRFFKIDLLINFAALFLTDFTDWRKWRYIHSSLVFSTQLVNFCPHGRWNYTCVLMSLYLLSDLPLPLPPSQTKCTVYTDSVWHGGGGVLNCVVDHILQECYTLFLTSSQNGFITPNKNDQ